MSEDPALSRYQTRRAFVEAKPGAVWLTTTVTSGCQYMTPEDAEEVSTLLWAAAQEAKEAVEAEVVAAAYAEMVVDPEVVEATRPRLTDEPGKVTKLTGPNSVATPGEEA